MIGGGRKLSDSELEQRGRVVKEMRQMGCSYKTIAAAIGVSSTATVTKILERVAPELLVRRGHYENYGKLRGTSAEEQRVSLPSRGPAIVNVAQSDFIRPLTKERLMAGK